MIKRVVIGLVLAVIIVAATVYYYVSKPEPVVDTIFKAVPLDAALLIDIKNYQTFRNSLVSDNSLWNELSVLPFFDQINKKLKFIDSLTNKHSQLRAFLTDKHPLLISGHPIGKNQIQFIYFIRVEVEKDFTQFDNFIQSSGAEGLDRTLRRYEGATIHDVSFARSKNENFSYTWSHGLLILSKSSILVENAIRQIGAQESLLNRKGLNEIAKTAGRTAIANFYFNFEAFPGIAEGFIQNKYKREFLFLKNFGDWIELDLNLKPEVAIFNGFSISSRVKPGFEQLFRNQKPLKFEVFNKIPATVNTFAILGISKLSQYLADYELLLETTGHAQLYKQNLKNLKDSYNIDLVNNFNDIFDQEACVVFLNGINDTIANQTFSVVRAKNGEDAEKVLNGFITEYANKNDLKNTDLLFSEKISDQSETKVWWLPFGNIPALLFGKMFAGSDNNYCTLVDNYLIFGNSRKSLTDYVKFLDQSATISTDLDFNNFSDLFLLQSNFFFYNKPPVSLGFYSNFFKTEILESIARQQDHVNKIGALVYQFNISGDNNLIYHNLFIKSETRSSKESGAATIKAANEFQLDAKPVYKPVFVKNPASKESEIFTQDEKNQVYLINKMGRILWKVKLSEPIISEIYQIDYYKNGKLQLLFNTRSKLYLIDRNGNNVEKYPVTLPKPATNGLALFDYDKDREYRILVSATDNKVYAFDKKGETISQWDSQKAESNITQPIQHFRFGGKDYLEYNDAQHIYVVDRKGKQRIKPVTPFQISPNNKFYLINASARNEARFVNTDINGKVKIIGLDGSVKEADFGKYPQNHWFDVYDVDGDGSKDYVFTWDNNLKAFSQNGNVLFSITCEGTISSRPSFYELSKNNIAIGFVTSSNNQIHLYDKSGKLWKGFPLKGSTQFSVDVLKNPENRLNLVVGSDNNLLYNYSVQ
jgi:hypothetical protein